MMSALATHDFSLHSADELCHYKRLESLPFKHLSNFSSPRPLTKANLTHTSVSLLLPGRGPAPAEGASMTLQAPGWRLSENTSGNRSKMNAYGKADPRMFPHMV